MAIMPKAHRDRDGVPLAPSIFFSLNLLTADLPYGWLKMDTETLDNSIR